MTLTCFQMCTAETTWADLEDLMKRWLDGERCGGKDSMFFSAYGLSKAALMVLTMQMAAKYPKIMVRKQLIRAYDNGEKRSFHLSVHLCVTGIHPD